MTGIELSLAVFAVCSALRIAAYFPQIVKVAVHPHGAAGFSYATWVMFGAANASTALYAGATLGDTPLALVHAISTICCVALLSLAAWRRRRPVAPSGALASSDQRSGSPAA
ncbi:MAG TPA: hypothetical protein PKA20_25145 [Burkholderiaceae bacterium]|nr:hypothetical protein [Burkholderiaceae bacterium]